MQKSENTMTSNRIRIMAMEAIENRERPLTTHEIEEYIKANDTELWKEIKTKCYDYVRMILSVTKFSPIIKFKCLKRLLGIDKRANFFGLNNAKYDPNIWIPIGKKSRIESRYLSPQDTMISPPAPIPVQFVEVDEKTAENSWKNLSLKMTMNDPVWNAICGAMKEVKIYIGKGFSPNDTVQYAVNKFQPLQDPYLLPDVILILSRLASDSLDITANSAFV
ncbi:hypothetical protein TRFO_18799 [Tritrichomonas foetus]|uniref:Uncharacterized protein n=1 Tax=Tritrichomonas foetus TaxID=1144522 RepID=A0A1J4KKA2_9EUKA|nr:hypothetical protein TRFO_18799 [Tritrichomonas foetus]|eukprot:OHT11727.1 hypothetical protein TRFO_18799 [Tritrichomonas foetus]